MIDWLIRNPDGGGEDVLLNSRTTRALLGRITTLVPKAEESTTTSQTGNIRDPTRQKAR